jgi:hypothetical protein
MVLPLLPEKLVDLLPFHTDFDPPLGPIPVIPVLPQALTAPHLPPFSILYRPPPASTTTSTHTTFLSYLLMLHAVLTHLYPLLQPHTTTDLMMPVY